MNISVKKSGTVLLPTLIISGMLLALALALTKIVSNELQFSADLLLAERSYFAAESGVEQALFSLKTKPVNWVLNQETELGHASMASVTVENAQSSFPFSLDPKKSIRWQFGRDTNPSFEVTPAAIRNFTLSGTGFPSVLQWKIQCSQENSSKTEMLQSRATSNDITGEDFGTWDNGTQIGTKTIQEFLATLSDETRCFFSLMNFGTNKVIGTFSTSEKIAPPQTIVRAKGSSGGREKIIEFEYRQNNLTPFFDFGLLQKN